MPAISAIPISPGQRQATAALVGLEQEGLVDVQWPGRKGVGGSGQQQPPDSLGGRVDDLQRLFPMQFQTPAPVSQSERVVLAQALQIAHLEAGVFGTVQRPTYRDEAAVGKDIAADEGRTNGLR